MLPYLHQDGLSGEEVLFVRPICVTLFCVWMVFPTRRLLFLLTYLRYPICTRPGGWWEGGCALGLFALPYLADGLASGKAPRYDTLKKPELKPKLIDEICPRLSDNCPG